MKLEKMCKFCGRLIIKDYLKWLEENEKTFYIQCPFCFEMERIR